MTHRDHILGAALGLIYVVVLAASTDGLGLSRDEAIYVAAADGYNAWVDTLIEHPARAFHQPVIDRHFRYNNEHPALPKLLFGLGHRLDERFQLFPTVSLGYRFAGMLSAGLLVWLVCVFGTRLYGITAGVFAALAYALLPRPFYHAHLACFDVPIALATTAVTYAYWRSLRQPRWAPVVGVLFGLALSTKHNSWLLPGIFGIHHAWLWLRARKLRRSGHTVHVPAPWWLAAMLLLGPPIFVGLWPWLWHDTLARLNDYAAFHIHHVYYNIEYFGMNYFWPPFPVSYPWVMTLYTVPVTTLLLAVGATSGELRVVYERLRGRVAPDPHETTILLFGMVLAPLVVIALPSTPIFGGTKHWITAYPFLAIFAGLGFTRVVEALGQTRAGLLVGRAAPVAAAAVLLTPAAVETAHAHPFALTHYGFAAGFVPGAADRGMNRQFWGFTTASLVDFLTERLPHGGHVYVCDTLPRAFTMLADDGLLPASVQPSTDIALSDFALVHHERHFAEVDHQIWSLWGRVRPVYVLTYDGVPVISVYENPHRRH